MFDLSQSHTKIPLYGVDIVLLRPEPVSYIHGVVVVLLRPYA